MYLFRHTTLLTQKLFDKFQEEDTCLNAITNLSIQKIIVIGKLK